MRQQASAGDDHLPGLPSPLSAAIYLSLTLLPAGARTQLLSCSEAALVRFNQIGLTQGTACSGSDIFVKVVAMIHAVLNHLHSMALNLRRIMSVTLNEDKRAFLMSQFEDFFMFDDVAGLRCLKAWCYFTKMFAGGPVRTLVLCRLQLHIKALHEQFAESESDLRSNSDKMCHGRRLLVNLREDSGCYAFGSGLGERQIVAPTLRLQPIRLRPRP